MREGEESVRFSQSPGGMGASRGSCALGDHYCNEGSMAATQAGGGLRPLSTSDLVPCGPHLSRLSCALPPSFFQGGNSL